MRITSDHRGFAGGQLPKVRPTPASIRSPELGFLALSALRLGGGLSELAVSSC